MNVSVNVHVLVLVNAGKSLLNHGGVLRIRDRKLLAGKGSVNADVCYGNENASAGQVLSSTFTSTCTCTG